MVAFSEFLKVNSLEISFILVENRGIIIPVMATSAVDAILIS